MRKTIIVASAALLLAGAATTLFYYVSPTLALRGLRDALRNGDSIALGDRVDFPRVRQSLKDQINASMAQKSTEDLAGNPFGVLAMALVPKIVDGAVDSFVTPTGLARLATGRKPGAYVAASAQSREPFATARIDRESLDRFSVWVPMDTPDESARFVFRRYGLSWKLTDILISPDHLGEG